MINRFRKSVSARRKVVSTKFISEAIDLEKEEKYKRAAIRFEQASPLIDSLEERAFILHSSFTCYKMAHDYSKAKIVISCAIELYRAAGEQDAANICIFELDRLTDEIRILRHSLRVNKGIKSVLRGCFMDSLFVG